MTGRLRDHPFFAFSLVLAAVVLIVAGVLVGRVVVYDDRATEVAERARQNRENALNLAISARVTVATACASENARFTKLGQSLERILQRSERSLRQLAAEGTLSPAQLRRSLEDNRAALLDVRDAATRRDCAKAAERIPLGE